eukprot:1157205-Pelagomonas_calceolata.AAC.2
MPSDSSARCAAGAAAGAAAAAAAALPHRSGPCPAVNSLLLIMHACASNCGPVEADGATNWLLSNKCFLNQRVQFGMTEPFTKPLG